MRFAIHPIFLALVISLGAPKAIRGDDKKEDRQFPKWAFCVAHVIRDADKRDERPRDPKEEDPFGDAPMRIPHGSLLRPDHILDVASLTARSLAQKQLSKESAEKVLSATLESAEKHPIMACYEPHHVFVFYSHSGAPVACIEVCLSCNRVKQSPKVKETRSWDRAYETADLLSIARTLTDASLPLNPYKSFHDFETDLKALNGSETKQAEGAHQPATAPESNPDEGKEKAKAESEKRSKQQSRAP